MYEAFQGYDEASTYALKTYTDTHECWLEQRMSALEAVRKMKDADIETALPVEEGEG